MQPKGEADVKRINISVPPVLSKAGTEKGRSARRWLSWCKHVGSTCRKKTQVQCRGVMPCLRAEVIDPTLPRKSAVYDDVLETVPQTNTGGWVENTKALERSRVKELGKLTP